MRNHWGENWNMKNIPNFREMGKSKLGKSLELSKNPHVGTIASRRNKNKKFE
jgi:hypothetical protein